MNISKRSFLKTTLTATGSLMVYATTGPLSFADEQKANPMPFIEMAANGDITFISSRTDMGQGSVTSLAQILLDEMDADWQKLVSVKETEVFKSEVYGGDDLVTVGAASTFIGWTTHREAGASLREGFKLAAAGRWQVDHKRLTTEKSRVTDPATGKEFHYHELYEALSTLYLPEVPEYKPRYQSNLVGKPLAQLRSNERVTGAAQYGIDINFPNIKIAMIERCPTFGGRVKSFDKDEAMAIKGVVAVLEVSNGIAVVADGFWAVSKARQALKIEWDHGDLKNTSSEILSAQLKVNLSEPMLKETVLGDAEKELSADGGKILSGHFSFPFVAHATMEPMNTTAWVTDDKCEIWSPTQSKILAHKEVAKLLKRPEEDITFHRTLCGGGFGRRAQEDFVLEAVEVSQKTGHPVKLIWTREDDIKHDYFRSMSEMHIEGKMGDTGKLVAWNSKLSFIDTSPYHFSPSNRGTDRGLFIGSAGIEPAYKIPNRHLGFNVLKVPITVGILRGISHGYTNFSIEVMIDRLAKNSGRDPLQLRAELLSENERAHTVISELQKIDTESPVADGMARGFAFAYEGEPGIKYQYYSAHMADVRRLEDGTIKVHKIWVVGDHGRVINPRSFKRQIHSSIFFALSMMRSGEITIKDGQIEQGNFDDYPVSLIGEGAENVSIKLLDNGEHPMGCGEKMQAGLQPAIANAIENLTGEEVTGIPIKNLA